MASPSPEGSSGNKESRAPGRGLRNGLFLLGFFFAAAATLGAVLAILGPIKARPGQIPIVVMDKIEANLGVLEKAKKEKSRTRVAFLGDSTVDDYPPGEKLTDYFRKALNQKYSRKPAILVSSLAFLAMGPASYYFLSDRIIKARPDLIVWEISFTHASERWHRVLPRPELAAWMAPERIPDALNMPVEYIGLTADELLFYNLIVQTGQQDIWQKALNQLSRVDKVRGIVEEKTSAYTGSRAEFLFFLSVALTNLHNLQQDGNPLRYNQLGEIKHFGGVLSGIEPGHPTLRFVTATVRQFREAGIPIVVYLNPINFQHLKKLGLIQPDRFRKSLNSFRLSVTDAGGNFLDLHRLLPDDHFADMSGHFRHDDEIQAQKRVADVLAQYIYSGKLLPDPKKRKQGAD